MNDSQTGYQIPFKLSHPVEGLHYLHMVLSEKNPKRREMEGLVSMYDAVWKDAAPNVKREWGKAMWESSLLIATLQKQLWDKFPPVESLSGGREALEWRERLGYWIPDPHLKKDLLKVIRESGRGDQVGHAIGLLYRMAENAPENGQALNQCRHEVRALLLTRIHRTPAEADRLAWGDNIRLLSVQSRYEQHPEKVDAVVSEMIKGGILSFHSGVTELLKEMYGKNRMVLKHETRDPFPDIRRAGGFEKEYEQSGGMPVVGMFPPLPAERLGYYRGQIVGVMLEKLQSNPSFMGTDQALLLKAMINAMPQNERCAWQQHLDVSVRNYMNRKDVDVKRQADVYNLLMSDLTEKTQADIWRDSIWRSRWEQGTEKAMGRHPGGKGGREIYLLERMSNSANLQFLVKIMGEDDVQAWLPGQVRKAVVDCLAERMEELPWWKETPSRAMEHSLRIQMGEREGPPNTQGVPHQQWEKYLAGLPAINELNRNDLLLRAMLQQQSPKGEERIQQRMRLFHPDNFVKDNDPLVFHLVPRLEGKHGQDYFGFLLERLVGHSVTDPRRYMPYIQQVLPFLDRNELLGRLEKPEILVACRQNPELAVTISCRLHQLREFANGKVDDRIEKYLSRLYTDGEEMAGQRGENRRAFIPQTSVNPAMNTVSNVPPRQFHRPGGLER